MDTFNLIAGVCSILSLLMTIFVANKVINISNKLNINNSSNIKGTSKQKITQNKNKLDNGSIISGGDTNVNAKQ